LPEVHELLHVSFSGFKLDKIDDKGLAVAKMDTEGDQIAPVAERNWLINLSTEPSKKGATTFKFPKAKIEGVELTCKQYADADLVEVKPELALAGVPLRPRHTWPWIVGGAIALIGGVVWLLRSKRPTAELTAHAPAYTIPGHLTPFTVLSLLRRMHEDRQLSLTNEQRRELAETIASLQTRFFDRPATEGNSLPDLEQIARQWLSFAR